MGKVYCHIIALSCISCTKPYLVFLLICFAQKIKGLDFMRKWGWFHGHVIRFTKNLSSRLKHQKTKIRFCRSKNNFTTTLISSCHWKTLVPFNLRKKTWKRIFKTNSELSQNHAAKQFILSKSTVNWLFNDIWFSLVISCFDLIIGVF